MPCGVVDGVVVLPADGGFVVLAGGNVLIRTLTSSSEDSDSLDLDSFSYDRESSLRESLSSELILDCSESDESNLLRKGY